MEHANNPVSASNNAQIEVIPFKGPLAAEVRCGDLKSINGATVEAIRRAWLENLVVLFRGQKLTDADLVAFGKQFGEFQYSNPLRSPRAAKGLAQQGGRIEEFPQITVVSNVVENGVALGGLGDGELVWHTDMSAREAPPNQTVLYALEVPPAGGRTGFSNMYQAWETLSPKLKERVRALSVSHDYSTDSAGYQRKPSGGPGPAPQGAGSSVVHPLVRTHPETGHDCLYLGRRAGACLVGVEPAESEALLNALWDHVDQPWLAWHHQWKAGDLLMWDNRCVMHKREPFDPAQRRVMHRVVIQGSKPVRHADAADSAHARSRIAA